MSRQNKKERQRLKRKRKQQELRKKRNTSVFQLLSKAEGTVECYINAEWHEAGEASIMALRPMPGGGNVSVAFLVDLWCSGLKDAFGRLNITRGEFEDHLKGAAERDVEMIPLDLLTARRLVAGGMRLCVHNGFRLPHKADRWAAIIGVTSHADADLSDFEKPDGKYRYVGSMLDLRKRLVGSIDDFLNREDVEFAISDQPFSEWEEDEYEDDLDDGEYDEEYDDEEEDEVDDIDALRNVTEAVADIREAGAKVIEDWLISTGQTPHPLLRDAFLMALVSTVARIKEPDNPEISQAGSLEDYVKEHQDPQGIVSAMGQIVDFTKRSNAPPGVFELMGNEIALVANRSHQTTQPTLSAGDATTP